MNALERLVASVVKERLGEAQIESIDVERDLDSSGEPILKITVIFDATAGDLDAEKMVGMTRHLKARLTKSDADRFPMFRFVSKSDAAKLKHAAA